MAFPLTVLEGPYLRDLLAQPQAISATVAALRALPAPPPSSLAGFRRRVIRLCLIGFLVAWPAAASPGPERLPPLIIGPDQWTAHWIGAREAPSGTNLMLLARRAFDLPAPPQRAVVFLTADTGYQLFVNGAFVARGPARSAAHHQSYDALDVTRHLRAGRNVLAVRFHHAGLAVAYHAAPRPGLLAQLETSDGLILGTDARWKLRPDPAWDRESPRLNRWHDAFTDRVDLRRGLPGWAGPDFSDADWPAAVSLLPDGHLTADGRLHLQPGASWWPASQPDAAPRAITPPWVALVPRDIPALVETQVAASRLVADGPLALSPQSRIGPVPLAALRHDPRAPAGADTGNTFPLVIVVHPGKAAGLIFDFGRAHNAYPNLEIEGPAGTKVDVLTTPYLLDGVFNPAILNSIAADRVILSGRRDRWEAWAFKPARYLALIVHQAEGPVTLQAAGLTAVAYPWTRRGSFAAAENPWLGRFWAAGARTIETVTTDAYTDNYRERRQYPQTSYYAARGNYAAFGDTWLQRRYLLQNAEEQEPDGAFGGYAPVTDGRHMPFLDAQFFWLLGWHDYLLFSGDQATVRRLLPAARRALARLAELAAADGLIADPPYPYWIDHANLDRRGANFCVNALHVLTLDAVAQTLDWLGEPGGDGLRRQAAALRGVLRGKFWSPALGLFADAVIGGQPSPRFSEPANALAIAARIADAPQTQAVLPRLVGPDPLLVPASPLFVYWTMAALCQEGRADEALSLLQGRFAGQIAAPDGNDTLWEEWWLDRTVRRGREEKNSRADAQGECGVFPQALTRWVAGLEATAPGQTEFTLCRPRTTLNHVAVTWPTPRGDLHVEWTAEALIVEVPAGTTVRLDLASLHARPGTLRINGVAPPDAAAAAITLPSGNHNLQYAPARLASK